MCGLLDMVFINFLSPSKCTLNATPYSAELLISPLNEPFCGTFQDLDLHLKWPNDIYASQSVKLGGIVVNSSINKTVAVCNVGKPSYAHCPVFL
jgi:biotin-(acetyl-CoA carboxylase) ligase